MKNPIKSYVKAKALCSHLGGHMPMDTQIHTEHTIGDPSKCLNAMNWYWMPILLASYNQDRGYVWANDQGNSNASDFNIQNIAPWEPKQPNGVGSQKCVVGYLGPINHINDIECDIEVCSVCDIPATQTFYLRGGNGPDFQDIDRKYILSVEMAWNQTKVTFEGEGSSQIIWHPLYEKTEIIRDRQKDESLDLLSKHSPFGLIKSMDPHVKWKFTNVSIPFLNVLNWDIHIRYVYFDIFFSVILSTNSPARVEIAYH